MYTYFPYQRGLITFMDSNETLPSPPQFIRTNFVIPHCIRYVQVFQTDEKTLTDFLEYL